MINFFDSLDRLIFEFLNQTIANPLFDKFFPYITDVKHWYLVYVVLLCISFFKGGRIGKIAAIGTIFLIAASDQISSHLLKNLFARIRPCNALEGVRLLVGKTSSYSFPSSHAVNNFAAAVFFARLFPKIKWVLLSVASIVALSRPIVGVHYPSDIIAGAIVGATIGYIFSYFALKLNKLFDEKSRLK